MVLQVAQLVPLEGGGRDLEQVQVLLTLHGPGPTFKKNRQRTEKNNLKNQQFKVRVEKKLEKVEKTKI